MNGKTKNLATWEIKSQPPLLQFKVPSIRPQRSLTRGRSSSNTKELYHPNA